MIRLATAKDVPAIVSMIHACGDAARGHRYDDMDGEAFVDDRDGELRGYVWFTLGRPDTWIRSLGVLPQYRAGQTSIRELLIATCLRAIEHGSQAVEGFERNPRVIRMTERLGGEIAQGARVRFRLAEFGSMLR